MKNISLFLFSLLIVALVMIGCKSQGFADNPISNKNNDIGKLSKNSSEVQKQLALARAATAKYHDIEKAFEDGYVDIDVVVQNMGYHLLKVANVNGTFDPGNPPLLVYSKNPVTGKMRLIAAEYAVPYDMSNPNPIPPEGWAGDDDVWDNDTDVGWWECHAWMWYNNPDGIFSKYNPRVHVDPNDVNHP